MELKSVGCKLHGYISFFFSVKFKNFCNVLYGKFFCLIINFREFSSMQNKIFFLVSYSNYFF